MVNYYALVESKSHAFLLERRMKDTGVSCELTFIPKSISNSLCSMGVRFQDSQLEKAVNVIHRSGLPGCILYKEVIKPNNCYYYKVED